MSESKDDIVGIVKRVAIGKIKPNPNNPRIIKNNKFKKLVKSIEDFEKMLEVRPLIVNKEMIVLGGNMRLKACEFRGMKTVPVQITEGWTKEEQKEFVYKDNIEFGEYDWEFIANHEDAEKLKSYGLEIPFDDDDKTEMGHPTNQDSDNVFGIELDKASNYVVLKMDTDIDWIQAKTVLGLKSVYYKNGQGKGHGKGIGRVVNWNEAFEKIKKA